MSSRLARPVLAALCVSAAVGLSACGEEQVDMAKAETEIAEGFERTGDGTARVERVDCPDDVSAEVGTRTRCTMLVEGDVRFVVDVRVTGDEGRIRWTVTGGTVPGAAVEERASQALADQVGQAPDAIECPPRVALGEGRVTRCTLVAGEDRLGVTITMTDDQGAFDVAVDETGAAG